MVIPSTMTSLSDDIHYPGIHLKLKDFYMLSLRIVFGCFYLMMSLGSFSLDLAEAPADDPRETERGKCDQSLQPALAYGDTS